MKPKKVKSYQKSSARKEEDIYMCILLYVKKIKSRKIRHIGFTHIHTSHSTKFRLQLQILAGNWWISLSFRVKVGVKDLSLLC